MASSDSAPRCALEGEDWRNEMIDDLELISAKVHEQWIDNKLKAGITSRKSESGEELIVPYAQLSEAAKELDRGSVRAVLQAQRELEAAKHRYGA